MAVAANNANYGLEGNCTASTGIYKSGNIVYGMLPIKALGISSSLAIDDFGNKFAYIVDSTFTTAASPSNFKDPNEGGITVNRYSSPSIVVNEPNALFAIISYGNNQKGAVPALATSALSSNLSTDVDEMENGSDNFNTNLISGSDRSSSTFDDIVFFKNKKYFLQEANLQFSIGTNNNSSQSQANLLPTSTITGITGFNDQTSLAYATSVTAIPSACQTRYSGSPTYTCTTSGPATISGSCSSITCNSTSGIGYNAQSNLPYAESGSGAFSCDIPGYSGIKNYTCTTSGLASITGGTCSTTICNTPAGTGYDAQYDLPYATSGSGTFSCATGYSGTKYYTCTTSGLASITGGTCSSACVATGGTNDSTTVPGSMIHIFTSSGSLNCSGAKTGAKILVVAAGGAGGSHTGTSVAGTGGGGGGGVVYVASTTLPAANYTINVAGKTNGTTHSSGCHGLGAKGANSTFSGSSISITANGGGGGGGCNTGPGAAGGSGGGGHAGASGGAANGGTASGVTATISANSGGSGTNTNPAGGGGGGGAAGNGVSASGGTAGGGGTGISYNISGSTWVFGSGGGGNGSTGGTGGINAGNGISGTSSSRTGIDAAANRGGGGGNSTGGAARSGDGGSGIVIIRY